ncbi:annexin A4-like [Arapaima gigas]
MRVRNPVSEPPDSRTRFQTSGSSSGSFPARDRLPPAGYSIAGAAHLPHDALAALRPPALSCPPPQPLKPTCYHGSGKCHYTLGNRGTVTEAAVFNADNDAQRLREAMKGAGTNEATIIEILAHRTIAQRQRIKEAFKQSVGKDLADELRSELTGNFEKVVLGLLMTAPVYDASELRNAIKGAGTDEACLIEVLASRSSDELRALKACYKQEYDQDLEEDICGDTSGMFRRVLVSLLTAGRDESTTVNEAQAVQDAKEIYEAGEARWGTDEVKFLTVLCVRNRNHLLRVFEEYKKISGRDIEDSIKREMSGCLEDVFLAIGELTPHEGLDLMHCDANLHVCSAQGLGTTDSILIRVMVSRAEIDMVDIKAEFLKMYGKTLYSFIKGDTSGDYRKILLELCGGEK